MNILSPIKRLHALLVIALVVGFALIGRDAPAALASPKTYTVTKADDTADGACDSDCSLREAIIAANGNPGADTITLPAKPYTLTIGGAGENNGATGDLDIADDLTIDGAGAGQTIIKGGAGWDDRIFDITSAGAVVALNGVTITKGNASGGGGGISNVGALTLNNSIVSGNTSGYAGGGIYHTSGGTLKLKNSTVSGNFAEAGGGICSVNATVLLTNSTVSGNSAPQGGGGIFGLNSSMTLTGSTVSGNTSTGDYGGGIVNDLSTLLVNNSTISGNTAISGGGISNLVDSNVTLNNVTITANSATAMSGGGIFSAGTLKVGNSLIAGNSSTSAPDCDGILISEGHNLLGSSASCSGPTDGVNGDLVGSPASPLDPQLGLLQDNGGATKTHALLDSSPAIDAGKPSSCTATDQRGIARPQGARCDIGAYEFDGPIKQNQTINFAPLPNKTVGDPPFPVSATASSGLPVTYTASGKCSISGTMVKLTGAGSCTITAHQPGDATYNPAADVARTFQIAAPGNGGYSIYLPLVVH